MKRIKLIIAIMLFSASGIIGQVVTTSSNSASKVTGNEDLQKYQVTLCEYKTDTLSYRQLKDCSEIRIANDPGLKVSDYTLVCRIGESDIYEYNGTGNTLPDHAKERIIYGGVTQFWLENIKAVKENIKLDIGTRKFILTK